MDQNKAQIEIFLDAILKAGSTTCGLTDHSVKLLETAIDDAKFALGLKAKPENQVGRVEDVKPAEPKAQVKPAAVPARVPARPVPVKSAPASFSKPNFKK